MTRSSRLAGHGSTKSAPKPRLEWMDCLRGISIVLVVILHAYSIAAMHSGNSIRAVVVFDNVFGPLRMPIMVFLSGLFVPRSLTKGVSTYFSGKLRGVAYPYFLWSGLMIALFFLASVTIGWKVEIGIIAKVFYAPIEHLWFLAYLFLFFVLAFLVRRFNPLLVAAVTMVVAFLPVAGNWEKFWYLASFFMLGVAAATFPLVWERATRSAIVSGLLLTVSIATLWALTMKLVYVPGTPFRTALVLAALVGASGVFMRIAHLVPFAPFRYIGRNSLIFYIVHWPSIIFSAPIALRVKWLSVDQLFIFGMIVGLLGPWIITELAKRSEIVRALFTAPKRWFSRANRNSQNGPTTTSRYTGSAPVRAESSSTRPERH
jgi:fucose 4-O-acetylase-like acetyltransferase